jgi:HAD superfamily hydrolase (TIGR01509 family)
MDGTLIDTEPHWIRAETEICAEHGVVWTHDDGISLVGNPLDVTARLLQERGVDLEVPAIIDALLVRVTAGIREHLPWQEDARRLLDRVVARKIPCALVTMSYAFLADAFVEYCDVFAVVVTGENVANGKPHPEPYLTAAALLGVPIERCLAIEDSPSGVRSALASGARTVGIRRLTPIDPLPGLSRVRTLDSLDDHQIMRIMGGATLDRLGAAA